MGYIAIILFKSCSILRCGRALLFRPPVYAITICNENLSPFSELLEMLLLDFYEFIGLRVFPAGNTLLINNITYNVSYKCETHSSISLSGQIQGSIAGTSCSGVASKSRWWDLLHRCCRRFSRSLLPNLLAFPGLYHSQHGYYMRNERLVVAWYRIVLEEEAVAVLAL